MTKKLFVFAIAISTLFITGCDQNQSPVSFAPDKSDKTAFVGNEIPDIWQLRCIGSVAATADDYYIYKYINRGWQTLTGSAVKVAVDPNGVTWVINSRNNIFRYVNNAWQLLPGTAREIAIGGNGIVYIIGTNARTGGYGIAKWNAATSNWQSTPRGGATKIAVDKTGNPWVITSGNDVLKTADGGSNWTLVPNVKAREICIKEVIVAGVMYEQKCLITTTPLNNGYWPAVWNYNTNAFELMSICPYSPMKIAIATNLTPFMIDINGNIRYCTTMGSAWESFPGNARELSFGGVFEE